MDGTGSFALMSRNFGARNCARIKGDAFSRRFEQGALNLAEDFTDPVLLELVRKSREGDAGAMEALYERTKTSLYGLVFRYTYNHSVAEDILQDVYIKVFTNLDRLEDDRYFIGWVNRVAVNTCLSYLRGPGKRFRKDVPLEKVEQVLGDSSPGAAAVDARKPLEEAIKELPARLRSVFLFHDVQGFKHHEIARILGCSVGTSKSHLFKARMQIRGRLEERGLLGREEKP